MGFHLLLTVFVLIEPSQDWQLEVEKDEIRVYTRQGENIMKDTRAEMILEGASLHQIKSVFLDVNGHTDWVYSIYEAEIIDSTSAGPVVRYLAEAPWPVSDREIIIQFHVQHGSGQLRFYNVGIPKFIPEDSDFVRVPKSVSDWRFTQREDGRISVEFESQNDPGGNVPGWLLQLGATNSPFETMNSLRAILSR